MTRRTGVSRLWMAASAEADLFLVGQHEHLVAGQHARTRVDRHLGVVLRYSATTRICAAGKQLAGTRR
jgi:hypothetical protein